MKDAPKQDRKPVTMAPPPPGAHEGERTLGVGLGVLVGILLGLSIGAITLLVAVLMQRGRDQGTPTGAAPVVEENPSIEIPRPTVLPDETSRREPAPVEPQVAPSVQSLSPQDGATAVPIDAEIVLTFASDMDPASLNATTVSVYDARRGANIVTELVLTYRADARQLTIALKDTATWGSGNTVDVEVSTQARDTGGTSLAAPFRMTFSTR